MKSLTFTELEAAACARLTGLLPLDLAGVAGKETGGLKGGTVGLSVDLAKCAGDTKSEGLCLTFEATSVEIGLYVKLTCGTGNFERLVYDVKERILGEIVGEIPSVDRNVAFAGSHINTSHS